MMMMMNVLWSCCCTLFSFFSSFHIVLYLCVWGDIIYFGLFSSVCYCYCCCYCFVSIVRSLVRSLIHTRIHTHSIICMHETQFNRWLFRLSIFRVCRFVCFFLCFVHKRARNVGGGDMCLSLTLTNRLASKMS